MYHSTTNHRVVGKKITLFRRPFFGRSCMHHVGEAIYKNPIILDETLVRVHIMPHSYPPKVFGMILKMMFLEFLQI